MIAFFDNPAVVEYDNTVGPADCREPVSNHKRRAVLHQVF
jgi:hypothetical protein